MKISLIGSGRVAFHLAQALLAQGHNIVQVYARDFDKTQKFAEKIQAKACQSLQQFQSTDLIILAVSDSAIAELVKQVHELFPETLMVHTSGSTDIEVISHVHDKAGVFYPLQTFSFERDVDWSATPLFVEALADVDQKLLSDLANSLSNRVYQYTSKQRLTLHLAAVFACNFSNYCFDMAKQIVDAEQVDFSLLYPLIVETAKKATENDPMQMQTGPAMRSDQNILTMHQDLLAQAERDDLKEVYQLLSDGIVKRHHSD
ncbi:pyrroline-5-carboxylate reductase [compost metagenome]